MIIGKMKIKIIVQISSPSQNQIIQQVNITQLFQTNKRIKLSQIMTAKVNRGRIQGNGLEKHDRIGSQRLYGRECRICLDQTFPLIVPCKCIGTVRYVHEECIVHWAQELLKKTLSQMEEDHDYQSLTFIDCELCKDRLNLRIQWNDVKITLSEAKSRNPQCFWAAFIINLIIGLLCFGCICFALATLVLVLIQSPIIDYQRFKSTPFATWSILAVAFVIGSIFFVRSIKQIISTFYRKQFQIAGVLYKEIVNQDGKEVNILDGDDFQIKARSEWDISHRFEEKSKNTNKLQQLNFRHENIVFHEQSNTELVVETVKQEPRTTNNTTLDNPALIN